MPAYSTTCRSGTLSRLEVRRSPATEHDRAHERAPESPPLGVFGPGLTHPDGAVCALRPTSTASRVAREFTVKILRSWNLSELIDDAIVIVSELVTNAVRHGLPPYAAAAGELPVKLTLVRMGRFAVVMVSDPSGHRPEARTPDDDSEQGRGLQVIEALSRAWGSTPLPGTGKIVWAALET